MRKRIIIDEDLYNTAIDYCRYDNRSFSKLVQEALSQIMRRYPRNPIEYSHERILILEKSVQKLIEENKEIKAKMARTRY